MIENPPFNLLTKAVILAGQIAVKLRGDLFLDNEVEGRVPRHDPRFLRSYPIRTENPLVNLIGDSFLEWCIRRQDPGPADCRIALKPVKSVFEPIMSRESVAIYKRKNISSGLLHSPISLGRRIPRTHRIRNNYDFLIFFECFAIDRK